MIERHILYSQNYSDSVLHFDDVKNVNDKQNSRVKKKYTDTVKANMINNNLSFRSIFVGFSELSTHWLKYRSQFFIKFCFWNFHSIGMKSLKLFNQINWVNDVLCVWEMMVGLDFVLFAFTNYFTVASWESRCVAITTKPIDANMLHE